MLPLVLQKQQGYRDLWTILLLLELVKVAMQFRHYSTCIQFQN